MLRAFAVVAFVLAALPASASAIFHGTPVNAADAPWSVTLTGMGVGCGGALIAPDRVLTAAHCVQGVDPARIRVRLGGGRWQTARKLPWRGAVFPITYKLVPSPTNPRDPLRAAAVDDIAVIVLAQAVTDVAPLPLVTSTPVAGEPARTVGRGRTAPPVKSSKGPVQDTGGTTATPRAADQVVEAAQACLDSYTSVLFVAADHLCTHDPSPAGAQACAGDSGSAVLVQWAGAPAVAGVVSWGGETQGRDCGDGLPDVSTRVDAHAALLTGPLPARVAPYALQRVRVRRSGATTLRCIIGSWRPAGATFSVRWWRRDGRGREVLVSGSATTHRRSPNRPLGCSVTARTFGGWATESSYNLL
jgi:secreted trypsin-like serine protease